MSPDSRLTDVAVVAIGRNEGERLRACLESVRGRVAVVVYVDSGSTDGSRVTAQSLGADVVELDLSIPFTAARARNAGWRRALALQPDLAFVQFVDGDCEVVEGWMQEAREFLCAHDRVVAVAGNRRERHPERSIYNRMCDFEWNGPPGEAKAFGGDVMLRVAALAAVGGYDDRLIAGEEPELCVRLRRAGGVIWRLDRNMTVHDAAMLRFGQWWRRTLRGGYAFALGASLHGAAPERHWVKESVRAWIWGAAIPLLALGVGVAIDPRAGLLLLLVYPLQWWRLTRSHGGQRRDAAVRAGFLVLGKFPEFAGQLKFLWHRLSGRQARLIEYK